MGPKAKETGAAAASKQSKAKTKAAAKQEAAKTKQTKAATKAKTNVKAEEPKQKKRVKKDKDAPKKPMSPFFCYQAFRRATLKQEQPTLNNTEIIKAMTQEWNSLTDEKKEPFRKQTEQ